MDLIRNYRRDEISDELATDMLNIFARKSEEMASKYGEFWNSRPVVELVMALSLQLKLSPRAKYQAIHLYDKFIVKHIEDVRTEYLDTYNKSHDHEWKVVFNRLCDQFVFRIITCLSISNRLESLENIPTSMLTELISKLQIKQSINGLQKSELRVMTTVGFQLRDDTLLDFAEILLYVIVRNDGNLNSLHYEQKLTLIIDFVYLHREELHLVLTEKLGEFAAKEMMLLGCAVIATISVLLNDGNEANVMKRLHEATTVDEFKINIARNEIIVMIINRMQESQSTTF